jgi:hypothetical protein
VNAIDIWPVIFLHVEDLQVSSGHWKPCFESVLNKILTDISVGFVCRNEITMANALYTAFAT